MHVWSELFYSEYRILNNISERGGAILNDDGNLNRETSWETSRWMASQREVKKHFPNKSLVVSIFYISDTSVLRENSSLVISYKTTSGIRVGYFLLTGEEIVDVIPGFFAVV